jgi:hypothetical protein
MNNRLHTYVNPVALSAQAWFDFLWVPSMHPDWLKRLSPTLAGQLQAKVSRLEIAHTALDFMGPPAVASVTEVYGLENASWVLSDVEQLLSLAECVGVAAYMASKSITTSVSLTRQLAQMLGPHVTDKRHLLGKSFDLPAGLFVEAAQPTALDPVTLGAGYLLLAASTLGVGVEARMKLKLPMAAETALSDEAASALDKQHLSKLCQWIEEMHHAAHH